VEFEAKRLCGVVKNKVAPLWKEAELDIKWGKGISQEGDILDAVVEAGVVSQSGGYFRYDDEMIGHGRENAKAFLAQHPELFAELRAQVLGQQPEEQEGEA
jgi:recombination protein RecA